MAKANPRVLRIAPPTPARSAGQATAAAPSRGIVIYGPQGCGKTTYAQTLARHYSATRVVDDWTPGRPVPAGTLALTSACYVGAIHFLDAAKAAGIQLMPAHKRALIEDRRTA
jgi:hypothetical protein